MAVEWFCQVMGSEVGPMDQQQLVHMVRSHQLNPEDLVRRGESGWVPAFEVKGLFEAAAKQPAAAPTDQPLSGHPTPDAPAETSPPQEKTSHRIDDAHPSNSTRNATTSARAADAPQDVVSAVQDLADDPRDDWFCIASGEKRGPMSFEQLQGLANDGKLRDRDRVWRGSAPKFKKACEVSGLN